MILSEVLERLAESEVDHYMNGDRLRVQPDGTVFEYVANLSVDLVSEHATRAWETETGKMLNPAEKPLVAFLPEGEAQNHEDE